MNESFVTHRNMKAKKSLFRFIRIFLLLVCVASFTFFILPLYTQSAGDLVITEIMYNTDTSGDWIEVLNASDSAITMTDIQLEVGSVSGDIAVHGSTPETLAANDVAVIVNNETEFSKAHSNYPSAEIYTAGNLDLPNRNNTMVILKNDGVRIDRVVYNINELAKRAGMSLHKTLGDVLIPAPATPGSIAINPVNDRSEDIVGISVATSVTTGGKDGGDRVFVDTGDVITVYVLEQEGMQAPSTITLIVGGADKTVTLSDPGVARSGTYTILANDADGLIRYKIEGITDSLGNTTEKIGVVTHEGKPVSVDTSMPTVSSEITPIEDATRKTVVFTITDSNVPNEISYKISATACEETADGYGTTGTEKTAAVVGTEEEAGEARIIFSDTSGNDKYVCAKVTDKAGLITYAVSGQITGIIPAAVRITEFMYAPKDGATFEWIEVTNKGSSAISLTDFKLIDGDEEKTIEHVAGIQTLAEGEIAIITRSAGDFRTKYSGYFGPLFESSFSLNDSGDTIGLARSVAGTVVDSVTYTKENGGYKNGRSLHVDDDGLVFEGDPSLGAITTRGEGIGIPVAQAEASYPKYALALAEQFNDNDVSVEGQNLFFTKEDSATVVFRMTDEDLEYTESNIGDHLNIEKSASNDSEYRVERTSVENLTGNAVKVKVTIYFSASGSGTATDNRVTVYPKLKNNQGDVSSKRSSVTVVRHTTAPNITNSTSATVLGFAGGENVIVPVTVANIALGDWVRPVYSGSCGDGLTSYIARNGGHGVYYSLAEGTYNDCTLGATDSAGNSMDTPLSLPNILVGQTE